MKPQIIDIKSILEAIPKYKTWYKYYKDILISVICTNGQSSYVRRKAKSQYLKTDNEMCHWHSNWQYSQIEAIYGIEKTGKKTYEIIIEHEGETHRIDSVIENTAIEFQHSLDVSLNEMNSRYVAHHAMGYTPYLVLDFTLFNLSDILSSKFNFKKIDKNHYVSQKLKDATSLITKLKKWYNSDYFKKGNLFVDFNDKMVRLVPKLEKGFMSIDKEYFLNSLLGLEDHLKQQIELEKEKRVSEENRLKEEAELKRIREQEERANKYKELCERNKSEIKTNYEFQFYRQCQKEPGISEILTKNSDFDIIQYSTFSSKLKDLHLKHHIYRLFNSQFNIPFFVLEYITINKPIDDKKFEYQHAEIILKRTVGVELRTIKFIKKKGEKAKLHSKRFELIEGFLHSINHPALTEYNEIGEQLRSEYYLFNVKIDTKEQWENLSLFCQFGSFVDQDEKVIYSEIIEKFDKKDKWNLQNYFIEYNQCTGYNLMPKYIRENYYEDNDLLKFYMDNYLPINLNPQY